MKIHHDKIEVLMNELAKMQQLTGTGYSRYKGPCYALSETDYLELLGGIVVMIDANENTVFINKHGCEILGCKDNGSYRGRNWFDTFVPDYARQKVKDCFHKLLSNETQKVEYYENPVLTCDGKKKTIVWHNTVLRDENKKAIGTLSTGIDITNRRDTEELLKMEHGQLLSIYNGIDEAIYVTDPKTYEILFINKALEKQFGRNIKGEKCYRAFQDCQSPCSFCTNRYIFGKNLGKAYIWDFRNKKNNRWYHCIDKAIYWPDGKMVRCEVAIDITDRKIIQNELENKERFLLDIFASIQDGISILDKELNIIKVNPAMEHWYSHAMPLIGKKCYEAYHCADRPCDICPTLQTLKTGQACCECVPKRGVGGKIEGWLDLYSFPLRETSTGDMKGVIEYVRDVTGSKNAEKEKELLNRDLLRSNRKLLRLAMKDQQTGLYNHRYFEEIIESEFYRAKRHAQPLSLIMLDIDYFKSFNDVYGHQFGDLILKQFAKKLRRLVRLHDYVIRYGGEEFIVISPGVDKAGVMVLARRIIEAIRLHNFGDKNNKVKLKLSMGAVSFPEDNIFKSMDLIELADNVLSRIKELGGDKIGTSIDLKNKKKIMGGESDVTHLKQKIHRLTKRTNQALVESIYAFAKTIELKDHFTGDHVERTVYYATETAKELGLHESERLLIEQAAILHDLGKIGISDRILLKKGKLTDAEFENIKEHPKIGADIIRPIQFLRELIPLILYHHERWDGKGYPCGLEREEIPVGARVIAIADVYQALISDRPYRKAFSKEKAIDIIKIESGAQFDPKVVEVFLNILKRNT